MLFTQRYNKTLQRLVYYVKSNTVGDSALLLNALLQHNRFTDYAYIACKSSTHTHCLKAINTNTGSLLHTDYTF